MSHLISINSGVIPLITKTKNPRVWEIPGPKGSQIFYFTTLALNKIVNISLKGTEIK